MFASAPMEAAFLLARVLFGGTLAFMGLNHFMDVEGMAGYAEYKGLPAPTLSVLGSGAVLVLGGLSLIAGVFPAVGAAAIAVFLLVSAATMHDFWRMEGEEAQNEMTAFLKNVYGAGAALAFLAVASATWPYALNVGL
ncbi:DoxX family protein [Halovivax cerinus]|uniref:DoxX family protein n=1 Tax=Halovivax cerinus TaxID=1487865 RepID=A0ABD5NPM3_9EURY|nr:DoxX family protein [Halovivax cerinus]